MTTPTRARMLRLLWSAPMALGICYFALWACAPMYTAPSPVPVADGRYHEMGVAGGSGWDFTGLRACDDGLLSAACEGPQLQAWYRTHYKQIEISVIGHGGAMSLIGVHGLVRGYFVDGESRLGLSGGLGWASAQVGLPMTTHVGRGLWIYTEPTVALARLGAVRIPAGLQVHAGQLSIGLEIGVASGVTVLPPLGYGALSVGVGF